MDNSSNNWPAHPCPNCGYCPCCGRANSAPWPTYIPVPVYPAPYYPAPYYPTTAPAPGFPPIVWMSNASVSAGTVSALTTAVVKQAIEPVTS